MRQYKIYRLYQYIIIDMYNTRLMSNRYMIMNTHAGKGCGTRTVTRSSRLTNQSWAFLEVKSFIKAPTF